MNDSPPDRYDRQARFAPLGEAGQQRLADGSALVCGCGALGSLAAELLVRAGVGLVRLVDRDFVELANLQRQVLFDEQDAYDGLPKSIAAANKLRRINSGVIVEPVVADVTHVNLPRLADDIDVIVDGTDNFATRYLVNDYSVKNGTPWVYGGTIGAEGRSMTIVPGRTPCLACLMPEAPPPGTTPTCDTAGVLGPAVGVIASIEAAEVLKILSGHPEAVSRALTVIELWDNRIRQIDVAPLCDQSECRVCRYGQFDWLSGRRGSSSAVLCGRNAVQLSGPPDAEISLAELAQRLEGVGQVVRNAYLLRLAVGQHTLTVFTDGRTIVSGTDDIAAARALHARYIGA
jgi:molybdopterin/thiamine biosynthesis adenylyltransferase